MDDLRAIEASPTKEESKPPLYLGDRLQALTLNELDNLLNGYQAAKELFLGISNMPCFSSGDPRITTNAALIIEGELDRLYRINEEIYDEAERRVPTTDDDIQYRAEILMKLAMRFDDLAGALKAAMTLAPLVFQDGK